MLTIVSVTFIQNVIYFLRFSFQYPPPISCETGPQFLMKHSLVYCRYQLFSFLVHSCYIRKPFCLALFCVEFLYALFEKTILLTRKLNYCKSIKILNEQQFVFYRKEWNDFIVLMTNLFSLLKEQQIIELQEPEACLLSFKMSVVSWTLIGLKCLIKEDTDPKQ